MKRIAYAFAIVAFTSLGLSTAAEARERGRGDGAFDKRPVVERSAKPRRVGANRHYSPQERRRLDRAVDRSSHHVKRAKHYDHHRGYRYDHRGRGYKGHWREPRYRHHHKRSKHLDHRAHRAPYAYGRSSGYGQGMAFDIDGVTFRWHEWDRE